MFNDVVSRHSQRDHRFEMHGEIGGLYFDALLYL